MTDPIELVADTTVPSRVAVIGGGRMGAGIAQVFLAAGARVAVVEAGDGPAAAARQRVEDGLAEAQRRGKLAADVPAVLGRLSLLDSVADLAGDTDMVVEAVPERLDLKATVLRAAESVVGPGTVLATNTSSLSVTDLGAALNRPGRFLGLHFFNPVPASKLVEVVVAEYLHATLGERFAPPQLLRDKVAAGDLGRKTGRGFYAYE